MAAEKMPLYVITDPDEIRAAVMDVRNHPDVPIVAQLPSLEEFVAAVYGDDTTELMVQSVIRPQRGIGAHWDVHDPYVDPEHPFVATYNRRGSAMLRTTVLDDILHQRYAAAFPEPTAGARAARRQYSDFAFKTADVIYQSHITPNTGLIIPQVQGASPLIHNITPQSSYKSRFLSDGGEFVKFAIPAATDQALAMHIEEGYRPYAAFLDEEAAQRAIAEEQTRVMQEFTKIKDDQLAAERKTMRRLRAKRHRAESLGNIFFRRLD